MKWSRTRLLLGASLFFSISRASGAEIWPLERIRLVFPHMAEIATLHFGSDDKVGGIELGKNGERFAIGKDGKRLRINSMLYHVDPSLYRALHAAMGDDVSLVAGIECDKHMTYLYDNESNLLATFTIEELRK
jgi:hypothetical protein